MKDDPRGVRRESRNWRKRLTRSGGSSLIPHPSSFASIIAGVCLAITSAVSTAQEYPARPIRLIAGTSPGGVTDLLARMASAGLAPVLGQSVVVDNRPGATGNLAMELVAKAPPDGHTLLMISGGNVVIAPYLYRLPLDPVNDLLPVFNMAEAPHLLVVPGSLPAKDLREFIAWAKANPGKVNYGSAGSGSTPHLSADRFMRAAGLQMVHVPYKGIGPALPDLISGRIQLLMVTLGSARPHLPSGAIRALAVSSPRRLTGMPEVPTSAEAGLPGWQMSTWFGVFAPGKTSPRIVSLLNAKLQALIEDPKGRQRLVDFGCEPVGGSAQSFAALVRSEYKLWGQLVKEAGVKLE